MITQSNSEAVRFLWLRAITWLRKESETTSDDLDFHVGSVLMDDEDNIWVVQSINQETDLVTVLGEDEQTTNRIFLIACCTKVVT